MGVNISAKDVNELRKKTGSGMMDCKKALVEAEGDFQKAIDILRKKGQKVSAARSNRETSEGLVLCKLNSDESQASILSFTCETDFVAKNEDFQSLAQDIMEVAFENNLESIDEVLVSEINGSTIDQLIVEMVGKIGEKIKILDFQIMSGEKIVPYIHAGSKLGVMLEVNSETDFAARTEEFQQFTKDVAMHIAASAPLVIHREALDEKVVERERMIYRDQALGEGKPENVVDRIVEGRLEKYFQEVCLMEQPFVKDPDKTVKDLQLDLVAKCGENISVRRFVRFVLGEEF